MSVFLKSLIFGAMLLSKINSALVADPADEVIQNPMLSCLEISKELTEIAKLSSIIAAAPALSKELRTVIGEIVVLHGKISVVLTNEPEQTASWVKAYKQINLSRVLFTRPFECVSQLVFEMCNATYFTNENCIGTFSNNENIYALFFEAHEYRTGVRRQTIKSEFLHSIKGSPIAAEIQSLAQEELDKAHANWQAELLKRRRIGWCDESYKWNLALVQIKFSNFFEIETKPFDSFYKIWKDQNLITSGQTITHSDLYRKEFRANHAYYFDRHREPQGREWESVCLGIGMLSLQWQITQSKLLISTF